MISDVLIDSDIRHDNFVLINNVLTKYDDLKEESKNLKIQSSFGLASVY